MEFAKTFIGILLVLFLFLLTSCDTEGGKQYETINKDNRQITTMQVFWIAEDRISDKCTALGAKDGTVYRGCARSKPGDATICEVYAVRPRDFDDRDALNHFGHEAWHCLGARHN